MSSEDDSAQDSSICTPPSFLLFERRSMARIATRSIRCSLWAVSPWRSLMSTFRFSMTFTTLLERRLSVATWTRISVSGPMLSVGSTVGSPDTFAGFSSTVLFNAATKEINTHSKRELKTNYDCERFNTNPQKFSSTRIPNILHCLSSSRTMFTSSSIEKRA
jgi:hypothetical protein